MAVTFTNADELDSFIGRRFRTENYLVKKDSHEKILLCSDSGERIVKHNIKKPADISVYSALLGINSVYLCRILDIGESDERYVVYEEYCEGVSLAEKMGGGMSVRKALEVACCVCEGLYALHSCNIVHRDIKPENIMVTDENDVQQPQLHRHLQLPQATLRQVQQQQ